MSNFKRRIKDIRANKIKIASIKEHYDAEYVNQHGVVTPFHILFKDYADDTASMDKEAAVAFCIKAIEDLNEKYKEDADYEIIGSQVLDHFREAIDDQRVKDGLGVLFELKDFLLENEGLDKESSIKHIFMSPRKAKKIASILNKLIAVDSKLKRR